MPNVELISSHWTVRPHTHPTLLGRARVAVLRFLRRHGVDAECRERAIVACDELLRNAADHADDGAVLSVCIRPDDVRVAVMDRQPADPDAFRRGMTRWSGLTLVWQLSRTLCVVPVGEGKSVVAEIARREAGS